MSAHPDLNGIYAANQQGVEDTDVTLVTKANMNDLATQSLLNPSCANAPA
jgi:hypothetical protein